METVEAADDIALDRRDWSRFNDVGFTLRQWAWRGRAPAFSAQRGAITYITGDTGSGKSTLFKLLAQIDDAAVRAQS